MISPELLRRYSCFAPISEQTLVAVAMIGEEAFVPAGTRLFGEGDPADTLSLIMEGEVDIQYTLKSGEVRTVDTLVAGDLLGWSAMIEPCKRSAIATARKDTRLIRIAAQQLRELCDRDCSLGYRLLGQLVKLLADQLEGARVQLATFL